MADVVIDGGIIELASGSGWSFYVDGSPVGSVDEPITGSASKTTVRSTPVALVGDVVSTIVGKTYQYATDTFPIPGSITISSVTSATGASKSSESSTPIIIETDSGSFTANVTSFATNPSGGADTVTPKTGSWSITDDGQGTVIFTTT